MLEIGMYAARHVGMTAWRLDGGILLPRRHVHYRVCFIAMYMIRNDREVSIVVSHTVSLGISALIPVTTRS